MMNACEDKLCEIDLFDKDLRISYGRLEEGSVHATIGRIHPESDRERKLDYDTTTSVISAT